jgi:hypothetical protein
LAHVADVEFHPAVCEIKAHILLLLLVARKHARLADPSTQASPRNGMAKGACPAGNEDGLIAK